MTVRRLSLVPWQMTVVGEVHLGGGAPGEARRTFSAAYAADSRPTLGTTTVDSDTTWAAR